MGDQIEDAKFQEARQFHLDKRLKHYHALHAASLLQARGIKQEAQSNESSCSGTQRSQHETVVPEAAINYTPRDYKDDPYDRVTQRPLKLAASSAKTTASNTGRRNSVVPKSLRDPDIKQDQVAPSHVSSGRPASNSSEPPSHETALASSIPLPTELAPPRWYLELRLSRHDHCDRGKLADLVAIRTIATKCQSTHSPADRERLHLTLRDQIHRVEFLTVNAVLVKKSRLLDASYGLPQIFHTRFVHNTSYPFDIENDAKALFQKWRRADFDADLLRGVIINKKSSKNKRHAARLDENYPNRLSPNFTGAGDLLNGQWWPSQLCALRDGAHGSAQAGIHGHPNKGAFSVVIAGSHYDDKDDGDTILYCGTEGAAEGISPATQRLQESLLRSLPIRVLRSHSLKSKYRPAEGLRFDGLYNVTASEILDATKHHYRFTLERQAGQGPIRYEGPYKKPTTQELEAYHRQRDLFMGS